jgi:AraC-like DNA-binding protein
MTTLWEPFTYGLVTPSPALQPYVHYLLDIRVCRVSELAHPAFHQPPEPTLGVLFHYGVPMEVRAAGSEAPAATLGSQVVGLHDFSYAIRVAGTGGIVAAQLTPLGAACFQGGPMREFAGGRIPLGDVFSEAWVRSVETEIWNTPTEAGRIACAERALHQMLVPHGQEDLVSWAAARIAASMGQIRVEALAGDAGCSERQLERRFVGDYGFGPKRFGRILRVRHAMSLMRLESPMADVAMTAGFSDQAHMGREFRAMLGTTPQALRGILRTRNPKHTNPLN